MRSSELSTNPLKRGRAYASRHHPWNFCPECGRALDARPDGDDESPFCPNCGRRYYHNPPPVVACLAWREGEVLLVKRGVEPEIGKWALPGGFMEVGETPAEAASRELGEEAGVVGTVRRLLGVVHQESATYGSVVVVGFLMDVSGEPRPGSDAEGAAFFTPEGIPPLAFATHRELLASFLEDLTASS